MRSRGRIAILPDSMRIVALWTLLYMLACAAGCMPSNSQSTSSAAPDADQHNPQTLTLLELSDKPVDFATCQGQSATVVVFTRSDCPISNRCAPEIVRLHAELEPQGVAFYLVYVDPRETADSIRSHLAEYHYSCQALRDPRHQLVKHCQATVTPEAVVFDRHGQIAYRGRINDQYAELGKWQPEPTRHDLAEALTAILAGQSPEPASTKAVGCPIADLNH